jgi:hypothetical protein
VNVTRWFTTVINQPNVKAVIGEIVLCTKMAEFDAKKFAEFSGRVVQLCCMLRHGQDIKEPIDTFTVKPLNQL